MNYHGTHVRQKALTLLRDGATHADVARQLRVPLDSVALMDAHVGPTY